MPRKTSSPLTSDDWIKAAFRNLAEGGVSAIKAEVLAKQLKTTKGSFYWHFKDVSTFRHSMLKLWETEATARIMKTVMSTSAEGSQRLHILSQIISQMNTTNDYGGSRAEPAIRDWGRIDKLAETALRRVDEARLEFVTGLFIDSDFPPPEARMKAELFYCCFIGLQALAANALIDVSVRMNEMLQLLLSNKQTPVNL